MARFQPDQEIRGFIEKTNQFQADNGQYHRQPDIGEIRRCYNEMCRAFSYPYPDRITAENGLLKIR